MNGDGPDATHDGGPAEDGRIGAILDFWFGDAGEFRDVWFEKDAAFDAEIGRRFRDDVTRAAAGAHDGWAGSARGCLALILLLDQMPRNLFRGDPRAWAADPAARAVADRAVRRGHDRQLPATMRGFVYMPFMHAEDPADQQRSVALFTQLGEERGLAAAIRHRDIIARFGRFPHRNAVLGRETTAEEAAFLREPDSSF